MGEDKKSDFKSSATAFAITVSAAVLALFGDSLGIEANSGFRADMRSGLGSSSYTIKNATIAQERANFIATLSQTIKDYEAGRFVSKADTVKVASTDVLNPRVLTGEDLQKLKEQAIKMWEDAAREYMAVNGINVNLGPISERKLSKFHASKVEKGSGYKKYYDGGKLYSVKTQKGNIYKTQDR